MVALTRVRGCDDHRSDRTRSRWAVIGIRQHGWHHARRPEPVREWRTGSCCASNERRGQLAVEQFGCRLVFRLRSPLPHVEAVCIAVRPPCCNHRVGMAGCGPACTWMNRKTDAAKTRQEATELIQAAEVAQRSCRWANIRGASIPPSGSCSRWCR